MNRVIEKMNNSKINGKIISVAKARFPASLMSSDVEKISKVQREVKEQVSNFPGGGSKHFFREQDMVDFEGLDSRTFREVLMGKPRSRGE
ncbi:hypothetical protein V6N13_061355 [Hibiscus sabdariffa]